jgi:hypothetical protein
MPRVGFEYTIPVSEWGKRFHALDRAETVISMNRYYVLQNETLTDTEPSF